MIDWNTETALQNRRGASPLDTPLDAKNHNRTKADLRSEQSVNSGNTDAFKRTIFSCVGDSLNDVEQCIAQILSSQHASIQQLVTQTNTMAGKRLRPILVLLASNACEPEGRAKFEASRENLIRIAAAAELVHMASLVHDDVMDQADTRRHQPTIYRSAGSHAALLLGDYLFTKAYATASSCGSTFPARKLASAATQLCEGELRQQATASCWDLSVREYLSIIGQKTASLCAVSCRLGAWQIGAPMALQRSMHRFGQYLGLAFQVFDDWLDYWGGVQTGKTLGTDFAQLKPTLPMLKYLQGCSPSAKKHFLTLATSTNTTQQTAAYELVRQSSAGERSLFIAQKLVERAITNLNSLPDSAARSALEAIALKVLEVTAP
jgi:octaprenyl-diphosphate synthase